MALPSFRDGNSLNPLAVFPNALLLSSLYHNDGAPAARYAEHVGGRVNLFFSSASNFPPDYLVIRAGDEALVCFAGTTNAPQWASHIGSALFPAMDPSTSRFTMGSAYVGEQLIEDTILSALGGCTRVGICGHSYGGQVAYVFALHLRRQPNPPATIQVMTFGAPRTVAGTEPAGQPDTHDRIVTAMDPVPRTPPRFMFLAGTGALMSLTKFTLGFSWRHWGQLWQINAREIFSWRDPLDVAQGDVMNFANLQPSFVRQHFMDNTYLPWSQSWFQTPASLDFLHPFANAYTGRPYDPPRTAGFSISPATEGAGWFPGQPSPIDATNQPFWSAVSAAGFFPFSTGGGDMSLMKGTFQFNLGTGGFSESLYAVSQPTLSYSSMLALMQQVLPARMKLSESADKAGKKAEMPLELFGIRCEDTTRNRDAVTTNVNATYPGFSGQTGTSPVYMANMPQNSAVKVKVVGTGPNQIVNLFIHGVPVSAMDPDLINGTATYSGFNRYPNDVAPNYLRYLAQYFDLLRAKGLGYRNLTSPWDVNGTPGPMAVPVSVSYDDVKEVYTFTMPQASPFQRGRFVLRGFKNLNFLNGRWPCIAGIGGANNVTMIRKARKVIWDGSGYVSPEAWSYYTPAPTASPAEGQPPGAQLTMLTTKKIGRPFGAPAGRAKAQPV